jgi:uncharacterized Tic20 family protein
MAADDSNVDPPENNLPKPDGAGTGEGSPPPLADGGSSSADETDGETSSTAADAMEDSLPQGLKGSSAAVALGQGTMSEKDEKTFAMLAHILGIIPLLGPLLIWILKKDESPFVDDQGRESIAYQFIVLIAFVAVAVLSAIPAVGCLAVVLWPAVGVSNIIMVVLAGLKANEGVAYRYPFALRVL